MKLIHFWTAVNKLAETEAKKAELLGIDERTLRLWKHRLPRTLQRIMAHPELIEALARDAQEDDETVSLAS
jgi:hypothetical protein